MSNIEYMQPEDMDQYDPKTVQMLLRTRAIELFKICDVEDKGFINKKDIQRMREPSGVSPEMLEEVFDTLDVDKNGFLTLDEFTMGFSSFLGAPLDPDEELSDEPVKSQIRKKSSYFVNFNNDENNNDEFDEKMEEENAFRETMEQLGASHLIDSDPNIKELWLRLRYEDPSIQKAFENFVANMCLEIKKSKSDFSILESALHNKSSSYDEHVKKLYEEMEAQIKAEKAQILAQEKLKERQLKEKLEKDLKEKEKQLQDSIGKQSELEQNLFKLNMLEYHQKQENEKLLKEKAMLEEQLQQSVKSLQDSKSYINALQQQTKEEKRNRARQALKATENIALERENLLRELNMLKETNKKLQDERDELQLQTRSKGQRNFSIMSGAYSVDGEDQFNPYQTFNSDTAYEDDEEMTPKSHNHNHHQHQHQHQQNHLNSNFSTNSEFSTMKREQPVGANANSLMFDIRNVPQNATPQRVFKIVFIGDSGVGKTSFVQRFCNNSFKESFSTTIGVDFQVKTINLDGRIIALQLWDTAGQERYRSITKQYFRKADGVICMYDVTSEQSYKNLRNWISSMKESTSEECVLTIIGNKIDLCPNEESRVVKYKDGATLADEQGTLFFETSSKNAENVTETMEAIARILQEKEDKQIEDVLNLRSKEKKKGKCCG